MYLLVAVQHQLPSMADPSMMQRCKQDKTSEEKTPKVDAIALGTKQREAYSSSQSLQITGRWLEVRFHSVRVFEFSDRFLLSALPFKHLAKPPMGA